MKFNEDGTYTFPDHFNRKQRKRTAKKIKKHLKKGHVFTTHSEIQALIKKNEEILSKLQKKKDLPQGKDGKPLLTEDVKIKIADLGNGCWTHHHFSTEI